MNSPSPRIPRFSERLIWDKFTYVFGVQALDLDGDGFIDLTTADTAGFVPLEPFAGEAPPPAPAPKDRLGGDFLPPWAPQHSSLYWFKNDGKGNFTHKFLVKDDPGLRLERHIFADLNNDGLPDLVIVDNLCGDILWFENPGPAATVRGEPWKRHVICKGNMPGAVVVAVADYDGDGLLDVACAGWRVGNCLKWFKHPGLGREQEWREWTIDAGFPVVQTVVTGDISGDGRPDLLIASTASRAIIWYENPGDPTRQPWRRHIVDLTPGTREPVYLKLVDLNRDGRLDIVVPWGGFASMADEKYKGSVIWYENTGLADGRVRWKRHVISDDLPGASYVETADLNADGWLEVVAAGSSSGEVAWFSHPGDPAARWTKHVLKTNWPNVNQLIVADLDRDGRPDIAGIADYGSMELRWWQNQG